MASLSSSSSSLSSLTLSELASISINIPHLIIASILYPDLLHPRYLTPTHIAAIHINTSFADSSSPTSHTNGDHIALEANNSIRYARAYGEYLNSLTLEQRIVRDIQEDFAALGWEVSEGMDITEFMEYVETYIFMSKLELEGVDARRSVLEAGWTAYMQVPETLKREMGLVNREGLLNGVNGLH